MFEMTNARRKSGGGLVYALAAVMFSLRDNNNEGKLPKLNEGYMR